jgi:SAM-dependent methyltransferase
MSTAPRLSGSTLIDPLAPGCPGRYSDGVVTVVHERCVEDEPSPPIVRTRHFCVRRSGHEVRITHGLRPEELDNDLAGRLAGELFAPGWLSGAEVFERVFTGIVRSTVDNPVEAWSTFYENTLRLIERGWTTQYTEESNTISGILPVYRRVLELVPEGRVLDVGSCFGFLALLLAKRPGTSVIASDIAGGTVTLLRTIARELGRRLGTLVCDGARIPLPDKAVDTVTVVHLLEHLEPAHGRAVIGEALRLARRRVVIAVPSEEEPTAAYGHVRTLDPADLSALGGDTGLPFDVDEHHGGWLVIKAGDIR